MAVAVPFIVSAMVGYAAKQVVTDLTGDETLGMIAGAVAGYWGGGVAAEGVSGAGAGASGGGTEVVAGGTPSLGTTSPKTFGEIGGAGDIATVGDGAQLFGGAAAPAPQPGLLDAAGGWVERNPMASSMGFNAVSSMASQKMREDELKEAEKEARKSEDLRYAREHQAMDPSKIPKLENVNRGLIEGGYRSPGARLREGEVASRDLPNYQLMLDRYKTRKT